MADTGPKPFVFVLMPFREDFNDIYALGIKAACDAAGAYCERVDEQIFMGSILILSSRCEMGPVFGLLARNLLRVA